jgi:hypothetical protein
MNVFTTPPALRGGTELDPLVQKLFSRADADRDGRVSRAEFDEFLGRLLEPAAGPADTAAGVPMAAAGTATARERLETLARSVAPTMANLRRIAETLGPSIGTLAADGRTFELRGDFGSLGILETGSGASWQWRAGSAIAGAIR